VPIFKINKYNDISLDSESNIKLHDVGLYFTAWVRQINYCSRTGWQWQFGSPQIFNSRARPVRCSPYTTTICIMQEVSNSLFTLLSRVDAWCRRHLLCAERCESQLFVTLNNILQAAVGSAVDY